MDVMYKIADEYRILSIQFIIFQPAWCAPGRPARAGYGGSAAQEEGQRRPEGTMGKPELKWLFFPNNNTLLWSLQPRLAPARSGAASTPGSGKGSGGYRRFFGTASGEVEEGSGAECR